MTALRPEILLVPPHAKLADHWPSGGQGLLWLSERFQWPTWHKGYAVLIAVAAVGVLFLLMLLWFIVALLFRLRFQFSIWSLLVLTVAVALPCSWLGVETEEVREQREAVAAIRKLAGEVFYDYERDVSGNYPSNPRLPATALLRNLLGDDFFMDVNMISCGNQFTDADLKHLDVLHYLYVLDLTSSRVTSTGLDILRD